MLTFTLDSASVTEGVASYTGGAYEGVALLPKIGELIYPVTNILFGFQHGSNIAFPITAMGSVGSGQCWC